MTISREPITVAMTGASGIAYTMRLLQCLVKAGEPIYFTMSKAARSVVALETDLQFPAQTKALNTYLTDYCQAAPGQITVFSEQQWSAPIASGSGAARAMVICPCTSGCVAAVANGMSDNLLERAADVMLKEKKQLIIVHRETPLSVIQLNNLLHLAQAGATILPANPGFYHQPQSIADLIDFIVARILDHLGVKQTIITPWGNRESED